MSGRRLPSVLWGRFRVLEEGEWVVEERSPNIPWPDWAGMELGSLNLYRDNWLMLVTFLLAANSLALEAAWLNLMIGTVDEVLGTVDEVFIRRALPESVVKSDWARVCSLLSDELLGSLPVRASGEKLSWRCWWPLRRIIDPLGDGTVPTEVSNDSWLNSFFSPLKYTWIWYLYIPLCSYERLFELIGSVSEFETSGLGFDSKHMRCRFYPSKR